MSGEPSGPVVVLATRNQGKVRELRAMVADAGLTPDVETAVVDARAAGLEDVAETGITFADNALLKARVAARASGLVALADDSGLSVDVLGGAPGIFSARWSGRHGDDHANLRLLLDQLSDIDDEHRAAQFVCAVALVDPEGEEHVVHGIMPGVLLREPVGENGFGYDPVFAPHGEGGLSCAQLEPARKDAVSHRSRAMEQIRPYLVAALSARRTRPEDGRSPETAPEE